MDTPAIQPPPPPIAQPVQPQPPKNYSGILIGILLLVIGVLVGMELDETTFISNIRTLYFSAKPTPTPTSLPTLSPTPHPTANWKTYTNTTYGYSVKYPPEITYGLLSNGDVEFYIASDTRSENGRTIAPRLAILYRGNSTPELAAKQEVSSRSFTQVEFNNVYGVKLTPLPNFNLFDLDYYLSPKSGNNNVVLRIFINEFPNSVPEDQRAEFFKTNTQILSTFTFLGQNNQGTPAAGQRVNCPATRAQVCPMLCLQPPPYLCGSDGKSYCSECQACGNPGVSWYVKQDSPCTVK